MKDAACRVVKVGGSLLDWADLRTELGRWLAAQSAATTVLIAGGGELADSIRAADRIHALGDPTAHWLAVGAMGLNSRMVASLLPDAEFTSDWAECWRLAKGERSAAEGKNGTVVALDATHFLKTIDAESGDPLPCSWEVTSDSIAARVAEALDACELALLKSTLPTGATTHAALQAHRYVDGYFARAAGRLNRVRFVDLRRPHWPELEWSLGGG